MVKIYILSDDFEKWIEKIKESIRLGNGCKMMKHEVYLRDTQGFISVEIHRNWNENERGKIADVVVLDKMIEEKKIRLMKASLLGHRGSIVRTEEYWEEDSKGGTNLKNEMKI